MPDACLTPEEVAERLKVLPKTVRKWLREGSLPGVKVGRQWRVAESTLDGLISGEISFGADRVLSERSRTTRRVSGTGTR